MARLKKAQSTLEYALLLAVVLLAIIYGANSVIKVKAKANIDAAGTILGGAKTQLRTATGLPAE